jgi:hypothetical protein
MASAVRTTNEVLQELAELGPLHLERPFSRDGFEQLSARYLFFFRHGASRCQSPAIIQP